MSLDGVCLWPLSAGVAEAADEERRPGLSHRCGMRTVVGRDRAAQLMMFTDQGVEADCGRNAARRRGGLEIANAS